MERLEKSTCVSDQTNYFSAKQLSRGTQTQPPNNKVYVGSSGNKNDQQAKRQRVAFQKKKRLVLLEPEQYDGAYIEYATLWDMALHLLIIFTCMHIFSLCIHGRLGV